MQGTEKKIKTHKINWPLQLSRSLCIWGTLSLPSTRLRPLIFHATASGFLHSQWRVFTARPCSLEDKCKHNVHGLHRMVPAFSCSRCAMGQVHEEAEKPASPAHFDVYAKIWFYAALENCNWGQFLRKNLSLATLHTGFLGLRASEGKKLQFQLLGSINIFQKSFMPLPQKADIKGSTVSPRGSSFHGLFQRLEWRTVSTIFSLLPSTQLGSDSLHTPVYTHHNPLFTPSPGISLGNGCRDAHPHKCSLTWLISQWLSKMDKPAIFFSSPATPEGVAMCLLMEGTLEREWGRCAVERDHPSRYHLLPSSSAHSDLPRVSPAPQGSLSRELCAA